MKKMTASEAGGPALAGKLWGRKAPERIGRSRAGGAAVMVVLTPGADGYDVIFEKRAENLEHQPGEFCFPGGAIEPGESPRQAAVRETTEELLVRKNQIRVLAPLHEMSGPGGRTVWSFLALLESYTDTFSRDEVDHIFRVPLKFLLAMDPVVSEAREVTVLGEDFPFEMIPGGREYPWRSGRREMYFYRVPDGDGEAAVWGMTATLLHAFLERWKQDISPRGDD